MPQPRRCRRQMKKTSTTTRRISRLFDCPIGTTTSLWTPAAWTKGTTWSMVRTHPPLGAPCASPYRGIPSHPPAPGRRGGAAGEHDDDDCVEIKSFALTEMSVTDEMQGAMLAKSKTLAMAGAPPPTKVASLLAPQSSAASLLMPVPSAAMSHNGDG